MKPAAALLAALCLTACGGSTGTAHRYVSTAPEAAAPSCEATAEPRQWAVVVGIDFYRDDRIPDLDGAVNDAWTFYHYLSSPAGGAIPRSRLRLLLNQEATRREVEGALGNFLAGACPQDQLIIYFAGHGAPEPGRAEEAFLLVHDTSLDNMVGTALSMSRLPDFLEWRAGRAGRLLMLVDACHSGNIAFPGARGFEPKRLELARSESVGAQIDQLVGGRPGWGAISATAPEEIAGESETLCPLGGVPYTGGIFTCHAIRALSGEADADGDGRITLAEFYTQVRAQVSDTSGGQQTPQQSGTLEASLVLAEVRRQPVAIPQVPERYRLESDPHPLRPYLWVGVGLTASAALAAGVLNAVANGKADDLDSAGRGDLSRDEFDRLDAEQDTYRQAALGTYLGAAALAALTGALALWDALDEPQGIDDVYREAPWLEVRPTGLAWRF